MIRTQTCAFCRFADPSVVDFDSRGEANPSPVLLCHRYPPAMIGTGVIDSERGTTDAAMAFPQVQETDWCGEYQPPEGNYMGTGGEQ